MINAPADALFELVADLNRHSELAGSGEVLQVRKLTDGPIGVGTRFEADEDTKMGPQRMQFVATSTVVEYEPDRTLSWTSQPGQPPQPRRIQWWYRLVPEAGGTRVIHEVEVDLGSLANILLKVPYGLMRGGTIGRGMSKTLGNLRRLAEARTAASPATN